METDDSADTKDFLRNVAQNGNLNTSNTMIKIEPDEDLHTNFRVQNVIQHAVPDIIQNNSDIFVCKICSSWFRTKCHLEQHLHIHSGGDQYACNRCSFSCNELDSLQDHLNTHRDIRELLCKLNSLTNKRLNSKKGGVGKKPVKCETSECSNNSRQRHFQCDLCDKKFFTEIHLKQHVICIHKGGIPYGCSKCDFKCMKLSELPAHLRSHKSDLIKCGLCSLEFRSRVSLIQHKAKDHA